MEIITVGLSPNTEPDDVLRAVGMILTPWRWCKGTYTKKVSSWFRHYFKIENVFLFSSGRSALTALLEAFGIGKGDEVIIQAFTCVIVPNAIRFAGALPVYTDIDESLNIDPKDLEKNITPRTKAIIVQHTFGTPADMDSIITIAKKHTLFVIEDCAHALGASYQGKKVGNLGDAAFFSFGRDKVLSSVFGGAAIVNAKLVKIQKQLPYPSAFWIAQQLFHPIAMSIILPLYCLQIGKGILWCLQKCRLLSYPVSQEEKVGRKPDNYVMRYPNALAYLLLGQLKKLSRYADMRKHTASFYDAKLSGRYRHIPRSEGAVPLRYGILADDPKVIMNHAKQKGIVLGNWYQNVIDPVGSDLQKLKYHAGSCPKAEKAAKHIVNLPTRIAQSQAQCVVNLLLTL